MFAKQHIFISPHFDDAALACGGQIAQLAAAGETVVVATVFGGRPRYAGLSPLAQGIHRRSSAGDDLPAQRRAEDRRALEILQAAARPGDTLHSIYRQDEGRTRWLYKTEDELFGPLDEADEPLVKEVAKVLATLAPRPDRCTLYAPLAVSRHVDHRIVREAAYLLQAEGYTIRFYEDFPRPANDVAALEAALAQPDRTRWQSSFVPVDESSLGRKIEAIVAYRSQLGLLFGVDNADKANVVGPAISAVVRQMATGSVGDYAERLWQLLDQPVSQPATQNPAQTPQRIEREPAAALPDPPAAGPSGQAAVGPLQWLIEWLSRLLSRKA